MCSNLPWRPSNTQMAPLTPGGKTSTVSSRLEERTREWSPFHTIQGFVLKQYTPLYFSERGICRPVCLGPRTQGDNNGSFFKANLEFMPWFYSCLINELGNNTHTHTHIPTCKSLDLGKKYFFEVN